MHPQSRVCLQQQKVLCFFGEHPVHARPDLRQFGIARGVDRLLQERLIEAT